MFCHFDAYTLGVRKMEAADIIEVDNFEELAALDPSYQEFEGGNENGK